MANKTVEDYKRDIQQKVVEAGVKGIGKGKLQISSSKKRSEAFSALIAENKIRNLGSAKYSCYVTPDHYKPVELACEKIQSLITDRPLKTWSKSSLGENIKAPKVVKDSIGEAVEGLVKENVLLLLDGKPKKYLSVELIRQRIGDAPAAAPNDRERLFRAYHELKDETRSANVEIYALRERTGFMQEQVQDLIKELGSEGKAVLGQGDYSLASEAVRSGAILRFGTPYLYVRMDEQGVE